MLDELLSNDRLALIVASWDLGMLALGGGVGLVKRLEGGVKRWGREGG